MEYKHLIDENRYGVEPYSDKVLVTGQTIRSDSSCIKHGHMLLIYSYLKSLMLFVNLCF